MVVKLDSKMVAQRVARSAEMMAAMALVSVRTMEVAMEPVMVQPTVILMGFVLA